MSNIETEIVYEYHKEVTQKAVSSYNDVTFWGVVK